MVRIAVEKVREQIISVLRTWGMPGDLVDTTAEVMTATDLAGIDSHGISMLLTYERLRAQGKLDVTAHPTVVRQNATTALVDGGNGLGHPAGVLGMRLAMDKARDAGIGTVSVRASNHFGAAGYYAALAAEEGLVGLVTSTALTTCVVPTRGAIPRLPTNPLAFAAPADRNHPFLLDMSTSTVAANKVRIYGATDSALPTGWVTDGAGQPIRGADEAFQQLMNATVGGLTPLGGTAEMSSHKGYGLAMMVQILAATLSGASFAPLRDEEQQARDQAPLDIGHFFLALDPGAFRPAEEFRTEMDATIDLLRATPPVEADLPVLVPGDPEAAERANRLRDGIPLSATVLDQLAAVCERSGAPFLLR